VKSFARTAAIVVAVGAGFGTLAGLLGGWSAFLDLFAHFRPQYAGLLLVAAGAAAAARAWIAGAAAAALGALNLALVLAATCGGRSAPADAPRFTMLFANVDRDNPDHARLSKLAAELEPDVIALVEVDQAWLSGLELEAWPHRVVQAYPPYFGVALYSRRPLARAEIVLVGPRDLPVAVASIDAGGREVTIVVAHPPPPIGRLADEHAAILDELADLAKGDRVVLAADLNASPWGARFRRLVSKTGLYDTRRGFGLQATYTVGFWPMVIPIDHVLVGPAIAAVRRRVERDIGSDHEPVFVELAVVR
jgi:endonuclease/exonuclease/phosphatase (EEP) superfamily protein YafD